MMIIFDLVIALLLGSTFGVITMCIFMINGRCEERMALCQIVLVEKTNKFSSNSSGFRWSYFVANKLLLIKILALK